MAKVPPSSRYDLGLVTLRRSTVVASLIGATVIVGWSGMATWLLLARDDLAGHLMQRELVRQYAYEDRIAALRTEIDKLSSRQLVNQDTVEAKVADLSRRQARLENRQAIVANLAENLNGRIGGPRVATRPGATTRTATTQTPSTAVTGSLAAGPTAPTRPALSAHASPAPTVGEMLNTMSSFAPVAKPVPLPEIPGLKREGERSLRQLGWDASALEGTYDVVVGQALVPPAAARDLPRHLSRVEAGLARVERAQVTALQRIESALAQQQNRLTRIVTATGVDHGRLRLQTAAGPSAATPSGTAKRSARSTEQNTAPHTGIGGPLVAVGQEGVAGEFETALRRVQPRIAAIDQLALVVKSLPIRRPVGREVETSSPFGVRLDPFTRGPAMHTGLDFRAESGSPIRAAGAGVVVTAEYSGGYGNMVEIDHGHGLSTRYAHLSAILVNEGQKITPGTLLGRAGSTGRSTGPHLHYETRIDGQPVNPLRFLRAGEELAGAGLAAVGDP